MPRFFPKADHPWSLYEGAVGTLYFLLDCLLAKDIVALLANSNSNSNANANANANAIARSSGCGGGGGTSRPIANAKADANANANSSADANANAHAAEMLLPLIAFPGFELHQQRV